MCFCTNIGGPKKVSIPEGNGFLLEVSLVVLQNSLAPRHTVAEIYFLEVHFRTAAGGKGAWEEGGTTFQDSVLS